MAEKLAIEPLRTLEQEPIRDGFVNPHVATARMVELVQNVIGSAGDNVRACMEIRSAAIKTHRGDVVIYTFDRVIFLAGEIVFSFLRAISASPVTGSSRCCKIWCR